MATQSNTKFKEIDDALEQYYKQFSVQNYRDKNGTGLFLKYIKDAQLDDPELPIEDELGDDCDPADCFYTLPWTSYEYEPFPIPSYAFIQVDQMEPFIFYILQCCYKYGKP
eukprot:58068_1